MYQIIKRGRLVFFLLLLLALITTYGFALYKLQVVEGEQYYEQSRNSIVSTQSVTAARGDILDRYGRVLVSNRNCNNLTINRDELFEQEDPNGIILRLCEILTAGGYSYNDELPISMETPFRYDEEMTVLDRERLDEYLKIRGLSGDISAVDLMAWFREQFEIDPNYDARQMRIIAGIRYTLSMHYFVKTSDYVFAEDVDIELISQLMESDLHGFNVEISYIREYNTIYAAHILGYVGSIPASQAEYYTDLGYPLNATVGLDGAEYAFEEYLHGTDGVARVTSTASGTVTNIVYTTEPVPGNHVYLTIDIALQEAAERALSNYITSKNNENEAARQLESLYGEPTTELITGGAIVAIDVNTAEPLAIASWPTYNLSTMMDNYAELLEAENSPLFNRAINGVYAPGSTFKPCTAIAAMDSGTITPGTTIFDNVTYDRYEDYQPSCWIKGLGSHGAVNVTGAITVSCNYFFYTVGDMLGIRTISDYAQRLGLGVPSGIELGESVGMVANPENKAAIGQGDWYVGDTLQAAIGQSIHQFTPLQIANYIATVANGGSRFSASILKSVRSYDYSNNVYERTPELLSSVEYQKDIFDAVQQGMYGVANSPEGTAYSVFGSYPYCHVAAKTGTAQMGDNKANNAVFVCYAPAEKPEIAIAVVVEKGSAGSSIATIARDVLDYYFSFQEGNSTLEVERELLH